MRALGNAFSYRGGRLLLALVLLLMLLVGVVVGRVSAPTGGSHALRRAAGAGPYETRSGVPVGYAHTRAGAVAAALNYGAVSAQPAFLEASHRERILAIIATSAFAREYESAAAPALAAVRSGPLGKGIAAGVPSVYESAPLGYRVLSYTPQRAVIRGWGIGISGNTSGVAPQASFQTVTSTLVWSEGDWRLDGGRTKSGPTPKLAEAATPAASFVRELQALSAIENAP